MNDQTHSHFVKRCSVCDDVISQCRCTARIKMKMFSVCEKCQAEQGINKIEGAKHVPLPDGAREVVSMIEFKGILYVALDNGVHYLKDGKLHPVEWIK